MQLKDLKTPWSELSRTEKLAIIERSNARREEAFEISIAKKTKSKKRKSKSKKKKKKTPKTAEGLIRLMKDMSEEDKAAFNQLIETRKNS